MADTVCSSEIKRYAVVTGANKGIGLEICRQLASNGIIVVLTARDTERGLQAVESLKRSGLSDVVVFHQLDVMNSASIASLVDFIKTQFGKLDILVNNAGIGGVVADADGLRALALGDGEVTSQSVVTNFEFKINEGPLLPCIEMIQSNSWSSLP